MIHGHSCKWSTKSVPIGWDAKSSANKVEILGNRSCICGYTIPEMACLSLGGPISAHFFWLHFGGLGITGVMNQVGFPGRPSAINFGGPIFFRVGICFPFRICFCFLCILAFSGFCGFYGFFGFCGFLASVASWLVWLLGFCGFFGFCGFHGFLASLDAWLCSFYSFYGLYLSILSNLSILSTVIIFSILSFLSVLSFLIYAIYLSLHTPPSILTCTLFKPATDFK